METNDFGRDLNVPVRGYGYTCSSLVVSENNSLLIYGQWSKVSDRPFGTELCG